MAVDLNQIDAEFKGAFTERTFYDKVWEDIGWFIHRRQIGFQGDYNPGEFLSFGGVYDITAVRAARLLASALLGMLWKNGARTFKIKKPEYVTETEDVKAFYTKVGKVTVTDMEHPKAGLAEALDEYMLSQTSFGTSGVGVYKGKDSFFSFLARDIKHCTILEDARGKVVAMFYRRKLSAKQIMAEYGVEKVPDSVLKAGKETSVDRKFTVIQCVKPRHMYDPAKAAVNSKEKPYMSVHYIQDTMTLLRESGYDEMPDKFCRFYKVVGEIYGRSPGTEAMPAIWEVNKVVEQIHQSTELQLKPPLALLDDGTFGNGKIDLSPNAFNIINISGRIPNTAPIQPVLTVGELQTSYQLWAELQRQIAEIFMLDKIFDLNSQQRMTLGEAQIRNELRSEPLTPIFSRQIAELFNPMIERCVTMEYLANRYGYTPDSPEAQVAEAAALAGKGPKVDYIPKEVLEVMAEGRDWYEIEYISPAARIMRAEELRGITNAMSYAATMSQKMYLKFDESKAADLINELSGVPETILKSDERYLEDVKVYEEAQTVNAQLQAAQAQANINKANAGAMQSRSQAQATQAGGVV